MTRDRVQASRVAEVRQAARAWEQAGVIDAPTRAAINAAYPSETHGLARAWQVLLFFIVSVAIISVIGGFALVTRSEGFGTWLFFGALLTAATEALDRSRHRDNGSDAATSFWAAVAFVTAVAMLLIRGAGPDYGVATTLALLTAGVVFGVFCWRWGYAAYGVFSAVAFFAFLAQFPGARLTWVAVGGLVVALTYRSSDRARLAPPHRIALAGACAVAAIAVYAAVNRYSVDHLFVEELGALTTPPAPPSPAAQALATAATALVPIAFIAWGIRARRRLVLDLGAVFAALSLATLREYVHMAPLWVVLCAAGAALLLAALALNRKLRRSADAEWGGFTARPLYSRAGALPAVAVVAGFAPDAPLAPAPDSANFTGGGGTSGGGGATGSF